MSSEELMKGARTAVNQCMAIKSEENVLIITDRKVPIDISKALLKASSEVGAKCEIIIMEPLNINGQEPNEKIAELMKKPDVLFLVTSKSLSHTKARREATKVGVRIASMPDVTDFSFTKGGLTADYRVVKELTEKINKKLENSKTVRITSGNGTDFTAIVEGREWDKDDGIIHEKGNFNNLPAGEISVAPLEESSNGIIIIDKMSEYGNGISYTVKDGFAIKIKGSELLEKEVDKLGIKARNIAEIGIGTNPNAKIIGNVLEDEKVFGTMHVALGNNLSFGGNVDVPLHVDGIILNPTLEVDGKILIKDGKWVFLDEEESLTRKLTDIAYKYAKEKYDDVEYLDLRKTKINNFEGFEAEYDTVTKKTVKLVEDSDVFIIGSPIYNGLLSSGLKNLFEFVNYKSLEGKVAGYILKSGSNISFLQVQGQLTALMCYFRVLSNPRAVFATDEDFNGLKLKNDKIEERIKRLVDETVKMKS